MKTRRSPRIFPSRLLIIAAIPMAGVLPAGCAPRAQSDPAAIFRQAAPEAPRPEARPPARRAGQRPAPSDRPLELTVEEAVLRALENNRALAVQRHNPEIVQTFEDQERAFFDPTLTGRLTEEAARDHRTPGGSGDGSYSSTATGGSAGVRKRLPTGTTIEVGAEAESATSTIDDDRTTASRLGLTVTQALLRGRGVSVNTASLRQAELDTLASKYELHGFAEALAAEAELAYWDYALAGRQIEIFEQSLELAEQQQREVEERIRLGNVAESELAAAKAEVALRKEDLINARSALASNRLRLLRLTNETAPGSWEREVVLKDHPAVPEAEPDAVEAHVELALQRRPDLNEARVGVKRGELEIVKTKNGLLPRMDLFITLGKTGYARSFFDSVEDVGGPHYDALAGVSLEYPFGNRDAKARNRRATLSLSRSNEAVANLEQLVELDVRLVYIEANRAKEQIAATAATRALQEEKLRSETEKFRVGKSTSLLVAQAQRDLVASRIAEIRAIVNYLKAIVDLHRQDGSLLERRGVAAPGGIETD